MPVVTSNGIRINYEEIGNGEPLILIMGLGADHSKWVDHVQAYSEHFRCIMLDNRGAGKSEKPPGPYTTDMMADDIAGVMDSLDIAHARIAGISMGSGIAQTLALNHPDRVRSMVLVSSWARSSPYLDALLASFRKMRSVAGAGDFTELLQLWIFTSTHFNANYEDMVQGQRDAVDEENPMPQHAFAAQCEACSTHRTLERLPEISVPSLITVGEDDIFTPLALSVEMHERMPASELLRFPGWGHCHHWEDLETFNSRTTRFLLEH
jgi:pimeloyl-ACP methyl ester carboxylesterase